MKYKQFILAVFLVGTGHSMSHECLPKSEEYSGEKFPMEYMDAESIVVTMKDLNHYLRSLKRTVRYFAKAPNKTDVNKAVGLYFMKAILKRTLRDDKGFLKNNHRRFIKKLIDKGEYVLSHFIYMQKPFGWKYPGYRVSKLFETDEPQVHSIAEFNRNRLQKWIRSNIKINDFHKEIDEATLPKEKYVELVDSMDLYFKIEDSDECLSVISYIYPEPIDLALYPCRREPECHDHIYATPSVAYALSHRFFNIMARRHFRRCYIQSVEEDDMYMDALCSHMYREAVYIARRGYFARDMFLEHVALCAMLGYEEFHRQHWFKKATSWIDEKGCIHEDRNFIINRSRISERPREEMEEILDSKCHNHPMALLVAVLAHAVRYTAAMIQTNYKHYTT